jgi:hypothetical protein
MMINFNDLLCLLIKLVYGINLKIIFCFFVNDIFVCIYYPKGKY